MSEALNLDYHYGTEADQYSFYRIPKILFTDERLKSISVEAKVLYGLMLDRMSLSIKNGWLDDNNRVFIYFCLENAIEMIGYSHSKVIKLFAELDSKSGVGLIERRKQGQGKPTIIYVKNFASLPILTKVKRTADIKELKTSYSKPNIGTSKEVLTSENGKSEQIVAIVQEEEIVDFEPINPIKSDFDQISYGNMPNEEVLTSQMKKSGFLKSGSQDFPNTDTNNTKSNNPEFNDTDLSIHLSKEPAETELIKPKRDGMDKMDEIETYREIIRENIDYSILLQDMPFLVDEVDGLVELMVETVCATSDTIRIGKQDMPTAVVKSRLLKLDMSHMEYVIDSIHKNTTKVFNIRAYMLTTLCNAPVTMGSYYKTLVNYNMYGGGVSYDQ